MAKLLGLTLGLISLLYSIVLVLSGWHEMEFHLKIYVLFVPSIFDTIAIWIGLYVARIWIVRLYHWQRGTRVENEHASLNDNSGDWLMLPLWLITGLALYAVLERFFG